MTHQEAKGLFCEADQTLLCGPCSERPEHAAHSHRPIPRAAEETRVGNASRAVWDLEAPVREEDEDAMMVMGVEIVEVGVLNVDPHI